MKAVLISIQPKWCELIASGIKTVEVRRTKPKIDVPFKCYIYCTERDYDKIFCVDKFMHKVFLDGKGKQKVIGEFVCDRITEYECSSDGFGELATTCGTCLTYDEILNYCNGNDLYGWHITDLVIYDKPKELSEFYVEGDCDCMNCKNCAWFDRGNGYNVENDCNLAYKGVDEHKSYKPIKRPPQSWCYVEEGADNEQREAENTLD